MSRKISDTKSPDTKSPDTKSQDANSQDITTLGTNAEPNIAEAAEKTGLLIRSLQSRLKDRVVDPAPEPAGETPLEETPEELERQLQEFFARETGEGAPLDSIVADSVINEIRNRVIDGVVERIMLEWDRPQPATQQGAARQLETQVIERLISRVIERLSTQ